MGDNGGIRNDFRVEPIVDRGQKTGVIGLCLRLERRKGGCEAEEEVSRNISMQREQTGCAREQLRLKA